MSRVSLGPRFTNWFLSFFFSSTSQFTFIIVTLSSTFNTVSHSSLPQKTLLFFSSLCSLTLTFNQPNKLRLPLFLFPSSHKLLSLLFPTSNPFHQSTLWPDSSSPKEKGIITKPNQRRNKKKPSLIYSPLYHIFITRYIVLIHQRWESFSLFHRYGILREGATRGSIWFRYQQ